MFNSDFYPTPIPLALKMKHSLKFESGARILEPSAGKGDLAKVFDDYSIDVIEKEPELRAILRENFKVIDDDFLSFIPDYPYTHIVMNPPFSNGVDHFLHAWDISNGTQIACLLNAGNLVNPTSKAKLILEIVKQNNGTIENLGTPFHLSERSTKVEVVLITVTRPATDDYSFSFKPQFDQEARESFDSGLGGGLASRNVFENYVTRYNAAKKSYAECIRMGNSFQYYANGIYEHDQDNNFPLVSGGAETFSEFCTNFRNGCWKKLFTETKISALLTTKVKESFFKMQSEQKHMAFTVKNIQNLFNDLFQNHGTIMKNCVAESFDLLTKYHKENRVYVEGWKTNDRWKVGRKVILPRVAERSCFSGSMEIHYSSASTLNDIEKGLCFITGENYLTALTITNFAEKVRLRRSLKKDVSYYGSTEAREKDLENLKDFPDELLPGKWYTSKFFKFKLFIKGTAHLEFLDKKVWDAFNKLACEGKNWIGG